jgi:hypothetical protein
MSKSKKLSKVELDVVVSEILKKGKDLKEKELKEKYSKEIELIEKEFDVLKEKYSELYNEFDVKKNELRKLCENNEISIGLNCLNDLNDYKSNKSYSNRKGYYLRNNIDNMNLRNEIYNELVINGINEEINIKEVIDNYVEKIVNS